MSVIASNFRLRKCHLELSKLMPFVFGEIKMTFWAQKKVSQDFRKGNKTTKVFGKWTKNP